jgi:hypothetical protein
VNARRVEITLSQERWDALEAARGHEPRASFIKRALDSALSRPTYSRADMLEAKIHEKIDNLPPGTKLPPPPSAPAQASIRARVPRGVKTARELAMERQRRLNEGK